MLTPLGLFLALLAPARAGELQTHVVFTQSTPLAEAPEILRRAFPPLMVRGFNALQELPLDPGKESFTVYVPSKKPTGGYGLLVFVSPRDVGKLPSGWSDVLDDDGVIFVSADNAGNDAPVRTRRMPLAVIAAENVMRRYDVDPAHVFVAGFSGGSRVALRLALAYPDLFRGALLNSGSDPIGTPEIPLPPAALFRRFQEQSRIFYVTGDLDQVPVSRDNASARSLEAFCVTNIHRLTLWHKAHETADEDTFAEVLNALLKPPAAQEPDAMSDCRAKLDAAVQDQLNQAEQLLTSGDKSGAAKLLTSIDSRYGGLAAPQSVALEAKLN